MTDNTARAIELYVGREKFLAFIILRRYRTNVGARRFFKPFGIVVSVMSTNAFKMFTVRYRRTTQTIQYIYMYRIETINRKLCRRDGIITRKTERVRNKKTVRIIIVNKSTSCRILRG